MTSQKQGLLEPWVTSEVNRSLRENIRQLRVNPSNASVDVQWHSGDWIKESFPFETRHFSGGFDDADPV
jgi:hypothetical protein